MRLIWRIDKDGNLRHIGPVGEIVMVPPEEMMPERGIRFGRAARFRIESFEPSAPELEKRVGMYFVFGGYDIGENCLVLRRVWTADLANRLQVVKDTILERDLFEEDEYPLVGEYCRVWVEMV